MRNEADPILGRQPAGDSMHSHEPSGGLPSLFIFDALHLLRSTFAAALRPVGMAS